MSFRTNRRTKRRFRTGWSSAAKRFVDDKTNYLIEEEGKSPGQAYAIAISYARREGYKIPKRKASPKKKRSGYVLFGNVASEISKRAAP